MDACIIGAGDSGLTLATKLEGAPRDVLRWEPAVAFF